MTRRRPLPDDLRVVDCVGCGTTLAADRKQADALGCEDVPAVAGRQHGRAFCFGCLEVSSAGVSGLAGGMATDHGSPSPWGENVDRAREGP